MLNVAFHYGRGNPYRIILIHGFTQSGEVWRQLGLELASLGFEVIAPDLPGHGITDPKYDSMNLWETGQALVEIGGRATYVGYSLGGRALLHAALVAPELVAKMILTGAKIGFRDSSQRQLRSKLDNALADRIEYLGKMGGLSVFIDEWLQNKINIRLSKEETYRELRLLNRAEGLAASLRNCGSGAQEPLWSRLDQLKMPILICYGQHDIESVMQDNQELMGILGGNAQLKQFAEIGHSVPFEARREFKQVVERFARLTNGS